MNIFLYCYSYTCDQLMLENLGIFLIDLKKNYSSIRISHWAFVHRFLINNCNNSLICIECQITSVRYFKCCLIFNLWHVILHMFWMKFMCDLFRMTKTENTGHSVNENCGVRGDIHFHYSDCLYRAPCKWHTHTHAHVIQYYFIFVTWLEKYQLLLHARVLMVSQTFAIFLQGSMSNTTIQYIRFNNNTCLYFLITL